jgi:oxygen-independent coproporphyrinogen III oxidase
MSKRSLIKKYNVSGPRYTSYPTALKMRELIDPVGVGESLSISKFRKKEISIYIHLPFCASLCWYCGCNKVISRNPADADRYLDYLKKDFELSAPYLPDGHVVTQLHLGGGTPTFLSPKQLMQLSLIIRQFVNLSPQVECSVEMDPRFLTKAHVQVLRSIGFNRASIGVQDMDPVVQKAIHRIQPFEQNVEVMGWLRESGFESVNMDLIYGLPAQTPAGFADTVDKVISMRPERLAVYNYAHLPDHFPSQRLISEESLPSADDKITMLQATIERFEEAGYVYIGMDHFALPSDELAKAKKAGTLQRNFQGYSTHAGCDIWAFGISAISQIGNQMLQRHKSLEEYYHALDAGILPFSKGYWLSYDDLLRRDVIMKLMCGLAIKWNSFDDEWNIYSRLYFARERSKLGHLEADGLLTHNEFGIQITEKGRLFLRNIAMVFDAYLPEEPVAGTYSKTV